MHDHTAIAASVTRGPTLSRRRIDMRTAATAPKSSEIVEPTIAKPAPVIAMT